MHKISSLPSNGKFRCQTDASLPNDIPIIYMTQIKKKQKNRIFIQKIENNQKNIMKLTEVIIHI